MSRNTLPGNPHAIEGDNDNGSENYNLAQATMALAYEQRTANMIAFMQPVRMTGGRELMLEGKLAEALKSLIAKRIDL